MKLMLDPASSHPEMRAQGGIPLPIALKQGTRLLIINPTLIRDSFVEKMR